MKSGILLVGGAALVLFAVLDGKAPTPSRPSLPPHGTLGEIAVSTPPTTARTVEMQAPLIVHPGVPLTFHRYECTVDCSGHEAGYEWAEQKGIDDPDDCGGNSESFIEGCRAYAEEQQGDATEDEDEKEDGDSEDE